MATSLLPCFFPRLPSAASPSHHPNRRLCPLPIPSLAKAIIKPSPVAVRCRSFSSQSMGAGADQDAVSVPRSVPVRVAHELLQGGHRYLDVRTEEEFSAGHAKGAVNVPYMFKVVNGMAKNPNFLKEVSSQFGKDDEIIVGCQSGKRSLMAATDLSFAGFTGITDIAGGYSAWVQNGLPSE